MTFDGDKSALGKSERFLLLLMALPFYKVRLEGMLLREEFQLYVEQLQSRFTVIISASKALLDNKSLKKFLCFALHTGNFINAVSLGDICQDAIRIHVNECDDYRATANMIQVAFK